VGRKTVNNQSINQSKINKTGFDQTFAALKLQCKSEMIPKKHYDKKVWKSNVTHRGKWNREKGTDGEESYSSLL
jgi:hypothetical protein